MNFARTLIIKPSSMGDVVQALPFLTALKEAHPQAHVAWLVARPFADLLTGHPRVDEIILFDRRRYGRIGRSLTVTREFMAFLAELRRKQFTAVIDLQGLFRSGVLAMATGAADRVGFRAARELAPLFYTDRVTVADKDMHAVDRYLAVAAHLGLAMPKATDHLPVPPEARAAIRRRLADLGLAAGEPFLAVCAHARWDTKQWPPERFAEVLNRLRREAHGRAVLIGSGGAAALSERVTAAMTEPPIDLTNRTTLRELVALTAEARAMLTNDSGPMHVAAAVGTPVVAVFGPTNPHRTGPYGPGHQVIAGRSDCSPCYKRECPYAGGPQALCCLMNVTAEEVAGRLMELWRHPAPEPRA
jgi:lipopolysaccharide heptosyltransferase I